MLAGRTTLSIRGVFVALEFHKRSATCLKEFFIVSPRRTVGMLLFAGFFNICRTSDIAGLITSMSVYTGIGVWFGINYTVSESTSLYVSGL